MSGLPPEETAAEDAGPFARTAAKARLPGAVEKLLGLQDGNSGPRNTRAANLSACISQRPTDERALWTWVTTPAELYRIMPRLLAASEHDKTARQAIGLVSYRSKPPLLDLDSADQACQISNE